MVFFKANYTIWTIFRGRNFSNESILIGSVFLSTIIMGNLRKKGVI